MLHPGTAAGLTLRTTSDHFPSTAAAARCCVTRSGCIRGTPKQASSANCCIGTSSTPSRCCIGLAWWQACTAWSCIKTPGKVVCIHAQTSSAALQALQLAVRLQLCNLEYGLGCKQWLTKNLAAAAQASNAATGLMLICITAQDKCVQPTLACTLQAAAGNTEL